MIHNLWIIIYDGQNEVTYKRRALAGNIILSGGMAKMPGLQRRLLQEIKNQLLEERYEKLENLDVSFKNFEFELEWPYLIKY